MGLPDVGLLILRLGLGAIFIFHALPKLSDAKSMAKMMKWPPGAIVVLGLVELLAGLAIVLGIYAELGGLLLALVMVGAIYHKVFIWKTPFAGQKTTGWEFDLILLCAALALSFIGAGGLGIEAMLTP